MINLLLGAPGGGKSYEAVVYHVLPAVKRGRLVITNLPLLVDAFESVEPGCSKVIELRDKTLAVDPGKNVATVEARSPYARKFSSRAFANVEEFASPWRMTDGTGPLYIVDECHFALPRLGTVQAVEEWFSVHRHYNCDVLLITQSAGKISAAIKDLVQVVYKVRKAVAFGRPTKYIRKVLDGVNGAEIAVTEREYKKQMFMLYRSHTLGVEVDEQAVEDVSPFIVKFKRATLAVFALMVVAVVWFVFSYQKKAVVKAQSSPFTSSVPVGAASGARTPLKMSGGVDARAAVAARAVALESAAAAKAIALDPEPFTGKSFHLSGVLKFGGRTIYHFMVSENGNPVSTVTDEELKLAGYTWRAFFACAGVLTWQGKKAYPVTCDSPQMVMVGSEGHTVAKTEAVSRPGQSAPGQAAPAQPVPGPVHLRPPGQPVPAPVKPGELAPGPRPV